MTELFDTALTSLVHLPAVVDRLAAVDRKRRAAGGHANANAHAAHGHGHDHAHDHRGGGLVDVVETPGEYTFLLDVPGFSKSDIQVTLEDDRVLVMKSNGGKRKREDDDEGGECRYIRMERRPATRFLRKFRLPDDADAGAIAARCENGVLTVTVRKQPPPEKKTKTVEVAVA